MIRNNREIGMKTRGFGSNENSQAPGSRPVCRVPHDDAANYDYYTVITVFAFKTQRNYDFYWRVILLVVYEFVFRYVHRVVY